MTDHDDLRAMFFGERVAPPVDDPHQGQIQIEKYQRIRRDWLAFCQSLGVPPVPADQPPWSPKVPNIQQIQAFLTHYARTKKGVLTQGGKVCVRTIQNDWAYMERDIRKHTGHRYTQDEKGEMHEFITKGLRMREGLSTKARPKTIADGPVIADLLEFLWRYDETPRPARVRVQLAMAVSFLWFIGLRTGELVQVRGASLFNEGFLWKDVHIRKVPENGGRFIAEIEIRNRKGKKGREDKIDKANLWEEEDATCRWRCPLTLILALAIADRAIVGVDSVGDLEAIRFNPDAPSRDLRIRPKMRNIPLLRRRQRGSALTTPDRILYGSQLAEQLKALGHSAGYIEDLVPYSMRRGFGNGIDKHLTAAERSRHFGHENAITFQHYLSRSAPCDVQSLLNGQQPNQALVDWVRSMRSQVDRNAPKPRQSSLYESRFRPVTEQNGRAQYRSQRKEYFATLEEQDDDVALSVGCETQHPIDKTLPRVQTALFQNWLRYDKDRSRIIDAFYGGKEVNICSAVDAVVRLLVQPTGWSYPSDKGSEGTEFCYACAKAVQAGPDWRAHCDEHIASSDMYCGYRANNGIVLSAALCPFCLGDEKLDPEERYHQWRGHHFLIKHLETHLRSEALEWPLTCPHPKCDALCVNCEDFWQHMSSHGLSPGRLCPRDETSRKDARKRSESTTTTASEPSPLGEQLKCASCSDTFSTLQRFIDHTSATHIFKRCPKEGCDSSCRSMVEFKRHLFYCCDLTTFVCDLRSLKRFRAGETICGKKYLTAVTLRKHKESHTRHERLRCQACGIVFKKQNTLNNHMHREHRSDGPLWNGPDVGGSSSKRRRCIEAGECDGLPRKRARRLVPATSIASGGNFSEDLSEGLSYTDECSEPTTEDEPSTSSDEYLGADEPSQHDDSEPDFDDRSDDANSDEPANLEPGHSQSSRHRKPPITPEYDLLARTEFVMIDHHKVDRCDYRKQAGNDLSL